MTEPTNVFNEQVISAQRSALISMYSEHVSSGSSYALVDFPDHSNVGDSAIWVGEISLLREITGQNPSYVCTHANFDADELKRRCPDGVIFIHGGGNLGDIWEHHQIFRERIIQEFVTRQVVQLPQSIKFRNPARTAQFVAVLAGHPDFHLYVRDRTSLAFAEGHFHCPVRLAPDSAFGMGTLQRKEAKCEVLLLMRTDDEKTNYTFSDFDLLDNKEIVDWLGDSAAFKLQARAHRAISCVIPAMKSIPNRVDWYNFISQQRVSRGTKLLSRGRFVITDRLHGHILSTLLNLPHVTLDNDYGKVSSYIDAWTMSYPVVQKATSAKKAVESLENMKKRIGY